MVKVSEHFYTIQGEGPTVGTPSYLIRLVGCNLICPMCDSKFSWRGYDGENLEEVVENLDIPNQCDNIIITGGEPSLFFDEVDFRKLLVKITGKKLEIETNALPDISMLKDRTIYDTLKEFNDKISRYKIDNHFIKYRISPKLTLDSYGVDHIDIDDIYRYYEITKPLIDWSFIYKLVHNKYNEPFIEQFIDERIPSPLFKRDFVYIMPYTPTEMIDLNSFWTEYNQNCLDTVEFCKKKGLRYCPRVHINVYGIKRGV